MFDPIVILSLGWSLQDLRLDKVDFGVHLSVVHYSYPGRDHERFTNRFSVFFKLHLFRRFSLHEWLEMILYWNYSLWVKNAHSCGCPVFLPVWLLMIIEMTNDTIATKVSRAILCLIFKLMSCMRPFVNLVKLKKDNNNLDCDLGILTFD